MLADSRAPLAICLLLLPGAARAASPFYHFDRPTFEAEVAPGFIVDDYSNPGYVFLQNDADMSAVLGETDYTTTGIADLNLVQFGVYCGGCATSFELNSRRPSSAVWAARVSAAPGSTWSSTI